MAITLLAELFDSEGNKLGESFFGNLMSAKRWAGEENATFIRIYDTEAEDEEERETYYLKSGARGQWNKTTKNMFEFVINRNKEQATS
jgi:hypothetical protein